MYAMEEPETKKWLSWIRKNELVERLLQILLRPGRISSAVVAVSREQDK